MPSRILQRKCACGNHTIGGECEQCGKKRLLQHRPTVGPNNDPLELEAERIAHQVVAEPISSANGCAPHIQRTATVSRQSAQVAPPSVEQPLADPGTALSSDLRAKMDGRFGYDFSHVRVHTGSAAERSAREVGADAYTVGNDIVFGAGRFAPHSIAGERLLVHELVHVVQQSGAIGSSGGSTFGGGSRPSGLTLQRQSSGDPDAGARGSQDEQKKCIRRLGACPDGERSGIPTCDEVHGYNEQCRRETGYQGPDVVAECPSGFVPDCRKSPEGELAPKQPEAPAPIPCNAPFKKADTFAQLIELIRAAEMRLSNAGISSAKDQIHALRGIYYGTTWSLDYTGSPGSKGEASETRNEGFQRFTRPSSKPEDSIPRDVRPLLDCGLFDALKLSQDVVEPARHIDFGHLLIALDARYDPKLMSRISYPYAIKDVDMGGTGTELVTWLGDLGGGAARVALLRVGNPSASVKAAFSAPSDYGGTINLEGDIAGFVVATSRKDSVTAPDIPSGKGLSDALQDYLSPAAPGTAWKGRAATFLSMYGGKLDPASGTLTNRSELASVMAEKIQVFACNYLASRVKDKKTTGVGFSDAKAAADHVIPASQEVAETFLDALTDAAQSGGNIDAKRFPQPKSKVPGACSLQIWAGGALSIGQ
ncbi:DUF4157 domain-containing protein [Bradyrhizobium sp. CNPSo 4016]|nr:DUF4157 domain-containing protein [Bradyrhizobium glycinis]